MKNVKERLDVALKADYVMEPDPFKGQTLEAFIRDKIGAEQAERLFEQACRKAKEGDTDIRSERLSFLRVLAPVLENGIISCQPLEKDTDILCIREKDAFVLAEYYAGTVPA